MKMEDIVQAIYEINMKNDPFGFRFDNLAPETPKRPIYMYGHMEEFENECSDAGKCNAVYDEPTAEGTAVDYTLQPYMDASPMKLPTIIHELAKKFDLDVDITIFNIYTDFNRYEYEVTPIIRVNYAVTIYGTQDDFGSAAEIMASRPLMELDNYRLISDPRYSMNIVPDYSNTKVESTAWTAIVSVDAELVRRVA